MKPPVIFLAFANDADDHLALLERRAEKRFPDTFFRSPMNSIFQLYVEATANRKDLSNYISEFKDRVAIFSLRWARQWQAADFGRWRRRCGRCG